MLTLTPVPEGKWLRLMANKDGSRDADIQIMYHDPRMNPYHTQHYSSPAAVVLRRSKTTDQRFLEQRPYRLEFTHYRVQDGEEWSSRMITEGFIVGFHEARDGVVTILFVSHCANKSDTRYLLSFSKEAIDRMEWLDGVG